MKKRVEDMSTEEALAAIARLEAKGWVVDEDDEDYEASQIIWEAYRTLVDPTNSLGLKKPPTSQP